MLTLRALSYFYLIRTFNNIPWVENPSIDDTQNYYVKKASADSVMALIITDLEWASRYAKDQANDRYNKARVTKSAVNALLADIHLWNMNYEKCISSCDAVLANAELELVEGERFYREVFRQGNSTESIFELQYQQEYDVVNTAVQLYYGFQDKKGFLRFPALLANGPYSVFNYPVTSKFTESENDIRIKDFVNLNYAENTGEYPVFKYVGAFRTEDVNGKSYYYSSSQTFNWILYRLADVILMKAEALVQLNRSPKDLQHSLDLINQTYSRANSTNGEPDSLKLEYYATQKDFEKLILRERQRELLFEGKRWFDLVRLARRHNSPGEVVNYIALKAQKDGASSKLSVLDALYFPIAQAELDANPILKQNPYYELTSSQNSSSKH